MASCSSSLASHRLKYDVFLNFRGEDTRRGFTSHLYAALRRNALQTFFDDYLDRGEEIALSLPQAIQDSTVAILVFSKNYAFSRWCLDELVKIIQCHHCYGQIVIPVFYEVEPYELTRPCGDVAAAFLKHEQILKNVVKIQKWKDALKKAAKLSGFCSQHFRNDDLLINRIVEEILNKGNQSSRIKEIKEVFTINPSETLPPASMASLERGEASVVEDEFPVLNCELLIQNPCGLSDMNSVETSPAGAWKNRLYTPPKKVSLKHYDKVMSDGVVSPPMELLQAGAKVWSSTLVGFFWNKRPAFPAINAWAKSRWGSKGLEKVLLREDGSILFKFTDENQLPAILEQGPWHIGDKPLFVKKWKPGMATDRSTVDTIPIWLQFHNLPLELWTIEGLSFLASSLGKPLIMDTQTAQMEIIGYAKICIEVQKSSSLPDNLSVRCLGDDGEFVKKDISITYPWKPNTTTKIWKPTRNLFFTGEEQELMGTDNIDNAKAGSGLPEKNLDMVTIMLEKDGTEALAHIPMEEKGKSILMEDTSLNLSKGPEPSQLNNSHTTNNQESMGVIDVYSKEKYVIADKREESAYVGIVWNVNNVCIFIVIISTLVVVFIKYLNRVYHVL